jgi:hypothetical protein
MQNRVVIVAAAAIVGVGEARARTAPFRIEPPC